MTSHRPPPAATWIISVLAPQGEREPIVGDLAEEYALRATAESPAAALNWCLGQVFASAAALMWVRITRGAWISTIGVALLGYLAVGVVEFSVNVAISSSRAADGGPLGLAVTFPAVVLISYLAARLRRGAAIVMGVMMLFAVTTMTLWTTESVPLWSRVAYFCAGPAAAVIGAAMRSLRRARA